jgi:uncharacterized protein YdaU (DUF1376 family)
MNYYRRYMADYLSKTASLSIVEHGAYTLLLDYSYLADGSLPCDFDEICRMVRAITPVERHAVQKVLDRFFITGPSGYENPRVLKEVEIAKPIIEAARTNGVKGGRPRNNPTGSSKDAQQVREAKASQVSSLKSQVLSPNPDPPTVNQDQNPSAAASASPAPDKPKRANGKEKPEALTAQTWTAYAAAYEQRYHVAPVPNAKVNGMLANFCKRIPIDEAPQVAAFFVRSNRGLYVSAHHAVDLMLRDAEGLRTEWATGHQGTETEARQADKTAATGNVFGKLIEEAEQREKIGAPAA